MNENTKQMCTRCVMDSRYPGISFDDGGVCNYCRNSRKPEDQASQKKKYEQKFNDVSRQHRGKKIYDCLLAYSGGKDSTYTLHLLKNAYGLNVLAVTYDNWFQSPASKENIANVMRHVNVDHMYLTPRFDVFRKIITTVATKPVVSVKALERATSICTTCLTLIRLGCYRLAIDMDIPMLVSGLSPGQAPLATAVFRMNAKMLRSMQETLYNPLHAILGDEIRPFFLEERHFAQEERLPYNMNPLSFLPYGEKEIYDTITPYGWRTPRDTDANSTNCLLNAYANKVHQEHFGFHPYAFEIAGLVRDGHMTREDGLAKLAAPPDERVVRQVEQTLAGGNDE